MGIKALEFWITLDEMREEGLPETFDYFRFHKGGNNCPFICVHTDAAFLDMLSLDRIVWPDEIEFDAAAWKIKNRMPGIYQKTPIEAALDENGKRMKSGKEAFLEHLAKMKEQEINYALEEKEFRLLASRNYLEKRKTFAYHENLDFSVLKLVVASNPGFPQKWNLNCLPGPLKDVCSEKDGSEVIGVSTSMTYGGTRGTYTALHVEDLDYASANVQFPWSAGKAWFAIDPEDQHILDNYIRTEFRANCASPLLHKDIILDLDLFDRLGIRWYYFIQRPGDIIITNPAAPHQVINLGYNLAESTNFYCLRHLVAARRRIACTCPPRLEQYQYEAWQRLATFVYSGEFRFLCKINGLDVPEPEEILTQILNEAQQFNESFSSNEALAHPKDIVTVADILKKFTQDFITKKPGEPEATVSLPTARCEIISTAPLDLASLTQPCDTIVQHCEEEPRPPPTEPRPPPTEPRPSTTPPPCEEEPRPPPTEPRPSTTPPPCEEEPRPPPTEPRPSTTPPPCEEEPRPPPTEPRPPPTEPRPPPTEPLPPPSEPRPPPSEPRPSTSTTTPPTTPPPCEDSFDLFGTPERTPSPRGRKRPPSPRLFEDPDEKAKRLNARADFFSQRRHYRGPPNRSYARASSPASSLASSPAYSPPPSAAQSTSSIVPAPRKLDPRVTQAEKIRKNAEESKNKRESRRRARATYDEKHGKTYGKHKPASAWFKGYIQCASRRIKTAEGKIAYYASRVTVPSCDWNAKLQTATAIKSNLERRRLLHNVLQKMYRYCSEDLQQRLDEGYLEQEIFRDFIHFHSAANMELLRAALESYNADFEHWENVLTNEDAWNAEFGLDSRYRIPCVEFSKLKYDVLDLL